MNVGESLTRRRSLYRLRQVAVRDLGAIAGIGQVFADLVGNHDRAMVAACAAEGDGQITFACADVVQQQVRPYSPVESEEATASSIARSMWAVAYAEKLTSPLSLKVRTAPNKPSLPF